jgi:hypothetical protein
MVLPVLNQPNATDPLTAPPHATEHKNTALAITELDGRLTAVEAAAPATALNIEQARLVASIWTIRSTLTSGNLNKLIIPLVWNLTDRPVRFEAAMISVLTPPAGASILVDIVVCASPPTSDGYDLSGPQDTILSGGKLTIAAGSTTSTVVRSGGGFIGDHAVGRWVAAVVTQIGSTTPGSDLTVQLNRLL